MVHSGKDDPIFQYAKTSKLEVSAYMVEKKKRKRKNPPPTKKPWNPKHSEELSYCSPAMKSSSFKKKSTDGK